MSRMSGMSQLPRLSRGFTFWLIATVQALLLFASSAPSPLYGVYQAEWGFSATMLTAVFAVYAIALLAALLVVGGISDHVGRRKVLGASLAVEVVSMLLFLTADGVGPLLAARAVQGLATGAATGATSSALLDLQPPDRPRFGPLVNSLVPLVGLAFGALGSGVLVEYAPAPKTLVYALLLVVFVLAALVVPLLPETSPRRPGVAASLVPRMAVPRQVRPLFLTVAPCLFAVWAVGGLYMSLGPSIAVRTLHMSGHLVGGLVIFAQTGSGALGSLLRRKHPPRRTMTLGFAAFLLGIGATLGALAIPSPALFFIGIVIAGYGFGTGFLGAFQTIAPLAGPDERAGLVAGMYVVCYLGFSVPAVVAGLAVQKFGLTATTTVYSVAVMVLAVVACAGLLVQERREKGAVAGAPHLRPPGAQPAPPVARAADSDQR
ncbi:MFS transporter [Streptomyces iranensis]|uniref:MFS family permease n=1 Tax=Streptomyces iranensis TaxID=576784 RepID=A0A061A5U0_9ACTN|nr:MFS transporter [Streptomyces iranensis]MBP2067661.1 MFS family permease [Streptomyces iranensis]CDR18218.1 major facilitator superfamily MFS_1 [Streptomyces iranensis]